MGMCLQGWSFLRQMYDHGTISDHRFSLCFGGENSSDKTGTVAGTLRMVGTDTKLHQTPMIFAEGHVSSYIMDNTQALFNEDRTVKGWECDSDQYYCTQCCNESVALRKRYCR